MHVQDSLCPLADSFLPKDLPMSVSGTARAAFSPEPYRGVVTSAPQLIEYGPFGLLQVMAALADEVFRETATHGRLTLQPADKIPDSEINAASKQSRETKTKETKETKKSKRPPAGLAVSGAALMPVVKPPSPSERPAKAAKGRAQAPLMLSLLTGVVGASLVWNLFSGTNEVCEPKKSVRTTIARALIDAIVTVESHGDALAKNERSSATGAGQFLDATWLETVRAHRPDLSSASEEKILELRKDADLSREMVTRFAEQNARILTRNCLPVTPGTLYLSHFAGGGGAVAVLSASDRADAATTMAKGDSRGKLTREKIVAANPFLKDFTVADLKSWAERRVRGALLLARN